MKCNFHWNVMYSVQTSTSRLVMHADCCSQPIFTTGFEIAALLILFNVKLTYSANLCGVFLVIKNCKNFEYESHCTSR